MKKEIVRNMLARIDCALCNKEVDTVECFFDGEDRTVNFRAYCHGDVDVCKLPADIDMRQLQQGTAFTTKKLEDTNDAH